MTSLIPASSTFTLLAPQRKYVDKTVALVEFHSSLHKHRFYNPWSVACALRFASLQINHPPIFLLYLERDLFSGYARIIQQRVYYMLKNKALFRAQLFAREILTIEIGDELSCELSVEFIVSFSTWLYW